MVTLPDTTAPDERAILGAILETPTTLPTIRLHLDGDEFWNPNHTQLFAICCDLADANITPNPAAVIAELGKRRLLERYRNGIDIHDLTATAAGPANINWHLQRLRQTATVRRIQQTHQRLGQHLDSYATDGDVDQLFDHTAEQALALTLAVDTPAMDAPVPGVQTWTEFTRTPTGASRWIVPGLIRRHDTIMILGSSGVGKSYLSRQFAMCLAAGIHPFTQNPIEPVRTLLVDLENAPDQTAEEAAPLYTAVHMLGSESGDRGYIWPHPEGLNLRTRADAALLERVIAQTEPDVLCMGSLYNAYRRGKDDWDTAAEDVQSVLKRLRSRYNLGLWLEHHMPRAMNATKNNAHTGTPFGGTMWERWPTHGRVLRRAPEKPNVYVLEQTFRGDRGHRDLPVGFIRGGTLPLTAIHEQAELDDKLGRTP